MITIDFINERMTIVERKDAKVGNYVKRDAGDYFYISNVPDGFSDDGINNILVEGVYLTVSEFRDSLIDDILNIN